MTSNKGKDEKTGLNKEAVEVHCPRCNQSGLIYIPVEMMPFCPDCNVEMVFSELLDEGKSY